MDQAFITTIPAAIMLQLRDLAVIEVGFGAGPGCVVGKVNRFNPPTDLETAMRWLDQHRGILKKAHIMLSDRTLLWFDWNGFTRHENVPREHPPRPGVSVKTNAIIMK